MIPACNHCGATPRTELVGHQHFVICRGRGCGDPDGKGSRPLTNGKATASEADAEWRDIVNKRNNLL